MSEYLLKFKMDLELKGYSPKTVAPYVKWVKYFINSHGLFSEELTIANVRGI